MMTQVALTEIPAMRDAAPEIERLTASLKRANETAEHFERHWYLRGDEIERLTAKLAAKDAEIDRLRTALLATCEIVQSERDRLYEMRKGVDGLSSVYWDRITLLNAVLWLSNEALGEAKERT